MRMHDFYALVVLSVIGACLVTSCTNIDVNAYHVRGGSTGHVSCKGNCP